MYKINNQQTIVPAENSYFKVVYKILFLLTIIANDEVQTLGVC